MYDTAHTVILKEKMGCVVDFPGSLPFSRAVFRAVDTALHLKERLNVPSAALYVAVFTLYGGFESYLRSHSFSATY
jgi:hypothetical protein